MRPDLLPEEYCSELLYLLEDVPPFSKPDVDTVFEKELGKRPTEVFESFDYSPVGSASFAQVHRAVLNGETVAVKIQRPGVASAVRKDIQILRTLARIGDTLLRLQGQAMNAVREFEEWTTEELDYDKETEYMKGFGRQKREILTPSVSPELCTRRIIVQEFIDGFTLNQYLLARKQGNKKFLTQAKRVGFSEKKVARALLTAGVKEIYLDGFFHGDMHPANIMWSNKGMLYRIDFGIVGTLTAQQRQHHLRYTRAALTGDKETAFAELLNLCGVSHHKRLDALREEHNQLVESVQESLRTKGGPKLGNFFVESVKLLRKYKLKLPKERMRYFRALITMQTVVYETYPAIATKELTNKFIAVSLVNLLDKLPEKVSERSLAVRLLKMINVLEEELQ